MTYDKRIWRDHFSLYEGKIYHFYLDGEGIVTIGIGCQVFDPKSLPMIRKNDLKPASDDEKMQDYRAVKALPGNKVPNYYAPICALTMKDEDILDLFDRRIDEEVAALELRFSGLGQFPEVARLVLVDMAFNLGTEGLMRKFPKFVNAFRVGDWKTCSLECRREGIQNDRNEWTRVALESLVA